MTCSRLGHAPTRWAGRRRAAMVMAMALIFCSGVLDAQRGRGGNAALTPRARASIDLTGYWVSLVTDDWRWRMVTPPKGDVLYLPLNAEGRRVAEAWDPARDQAAGEACRAYGAGGVMSLPGRLHITWVDDATLQVEIDTGTQTRAFHFGETAATPGAPSWQGYSIAEWQPAGGGRRGAAEGQPGSLKVVTTRLRPGYFRKNGVPYGANAILTEYYALIPGAQGETYLAITKILEDPQYLNAPYVRTVQFRKQNDASGWNPTPCEAS